MGAGDDFREIAVGCAHGQERPNQNVERNGGIAGFRVSDGRVWNVKFERAGG